GRHHDTVGPDHDLTVEIGRYWSCSLRRPATPAAMSTTKTAVQTTFPVPPGRGRRAAGATGERRGRRAAAGGGPRATTGTPREGPRAPPPSRRTGRRPPSEPGP